MGEEDKIFQRQSIESQSHEKGTLILQFLLGLSRDRSSWCQEIIEFMECCMISPNIRQPQGDESIVGLKESLGLYMCT